jgi:hypothetical protein
LDEKNTSNYGWKTFEMVENLNKMKKTPKITKNKRIKKNENKVK